MERKNVLMKGHLDTWSIDVEMDEQAQRRII